LKEKENTIKTCGNDLTQSDVETRFPCIKQARKFAAAMKAPLIFCSSQGEGINVQQIFKIVLSKVFDLKCTIPVISDVGQPIIEY